MKYISMTKKAAMLLTTGILLAGSPAMTKAADPVAVGMPNPMVAYDSVIDAKKAAGFTPLYLPELSGYHVKAVFVYHKDLVDIRYVAAGDKQLTASKLLSPKFLPHQRPNQTAMQPIGP